MSTQQLTLKPSETEKNGQLRVGKNVGFDSAFVRLRVVIKIPITPGGGRQQQGDFHTHQSDMYGSEVESTTFLLRSDRLQLPFNSSPC